jgi:class 3 adenylate cyclase
MPSKEASDPDWSEVRLDRDRLAGLLEAHAPPDWEERFHKEELLDVIAGGESIQMFVMAADIRESTMLMKEAIKFERFAYVMLVDLFHRRVLEDFRANSRNLSGGVGLSMGLDAGPGYLVQIAGELTIVGPPVVGAVRMVTAATMPREILANVYLGEHLHEQQDGTYEALGMASTREYRPTKEYPKGQEVYALTFDPREAEEGSEAPDR